MINPENPYLRALAEGDGDGLIGTEGYINEFEMDPPAQIETTLVPEEPQP